MPFQVMPLKKQLSYLFAAVTRQDVMCSKVFETRTNEWYSNVNNWRYSWVEARPSPMNPNKYIVKSCQYDRHDAALMLSGDRSYTEWEYRVKNSENAPYFSKAEALAFIREKEVDLQRMEDGFMHSQPLAVRPLIAIPV